MLDGDGLGVRADDMREWVGGIAGGVFLGAADGRLFEGDAVEVGGRVAARWRWRWRCLWASVWVFASEVGFLGLDG